MRIRQIKPSWFLDKELRKGVTAEAREFYIGLWMVADDAGWFAWDVERIAAELYSYGSIRKREDNVAKWATSLETLNSESPHLVVYTCGHAFVPKMAGHQRIAGRISVAVWDKHKKDCRDVSSRLSLPVANVGYTASEPLVATRSPGREPGRERNGTSREATEFGRKVPRVAALGKT